MCIEIYKATSSPSPSFMGAIFKVKMPQRRPRDKCKVIFQSYFRRKNRTVYGPKILNLLPYQIKHLVNLKVFKTIVKTWGGASYSCPTCINIC